MLTDGKEKLWMLSDRRTSSRVLGKYPTKYLHQGISQIPRTPLPAHRHSSRSWPPFPTVQTRFFTISPPVSTPRISSRFPVSRVISTLSRCLYLFSTHFACVGLLYPPWSPVLHADLVGQSGPRQPRQISRGAAGILAICTSQPRGHPTVGVSYIAPSIRRGCKACILYSYSVCCHT